MFLKCQEVWQVGVLVVVLPKDQMNTLGERFAWRGLGTGENYGYSAHFKKYFYWIEKTCFVGINIPEFKIIQNFGDTHLWEHTHELMKLGRIFSNWKGYK